MNYWLSSKPYESKQQASNDIENCEWEHYENATHKELFKALLQGYSYSPVFHGDRRLKNKFKESYFVFVDIDDSNIPMMDFIQSHFTFDAGLEFLCESLPPTFAYPSFTHHLNLDDGTTIYKFHLVWAFDRPLNAEQYQSVQKRLIEECNIETYDRRTLEVARCYFGTSTKEDDCYYNGVTYDPTTLLDGYTITVEETKENSNMELPKEVIDGLCNKSVTTTELLFTLTGRQYTDYITTTEVFSIGYAKLWLKDDYKHITLPYKPLKDGKHRRMVFSNIMLQLKDINPYISYWEYMLVGICIANFHFEHDKDFGDTDTVKPIITASFNKEPHIDWSYCRSKHKGAYIAKGLKRQGIKRG